MGFSTGFTLENHVIAALERERCRVDTHPTWDHKHKLDCVVLSIPGFKPRPIGLQVTAKPNQFAKMSEFLQVQRSSAALVERTLYLEIDPAAVQEEGGLSLVGIILRQFLADRKLQDRKCLGARIHPDSTYEFFDIEQAIAGFATEAVAARRTDTVTVPIPPAWSTAPQWPPISLTTAVPLHTAPPKPVPSKAPIVVDVSLLKRAIQGETLARARLGVLTSYRPSNRYGMAQAQDGSTFFVHFSNVIDPALKDRLEAYYGELPVKLEIPISFCDGGRTKEGVKYNTAKQVAIVR